MTSMRQKLIHAGSEIDLVESMVQPNLVDINDFCKRNTNLDTYSGLKPSLKPLKWSKMQKWNSHNDADVESAELPQKKIIYIKTFNHVKNEPIVMHPMNYQAKTLYNESKNTRNDQNNGKKKTGIDIDSRIALSFFKMNKEKFNPIKQITKIQEPNQNKLNDDNSTLKEFEFLTGVNLQEADTFREEKPEGASQDLKESSEIKFEEFVEKQYNLMAPQITNDDSRKETTKDSTLQRYNREQNNLPTIKKTISTNEQALISVSEARYKKHLEKKPKIFISWKTNSVQPFGRPIDYKDHLTRVFNKESTPTVQYPLISHLGPRKDYRKEILETYLAQFNLEALKEIDENLYELAKLKAST